MSICHSQAPRWLPMTPTSWISAFFFVVVSQMAWGLVCVTNRIRQEWWNVTYQTILRLFAPEDTRAALWWDSSREEPRPSANSPCSEPAWKSILQAQASLRMTTVLSTILIATSWNPWEKTIQLSHFLIFNTQKLCVVINICSFKILRFEEVCYLVIDN